jgi:hypothetical protein
MPAASAGCSCDIDAQYQWKSAGVHWCICWQNTAWHTWVRSALDITPSLSQSKCLNACMVMGGTAINANIAFVIVSS